MNDLKYLIALNTFEKFGASNLARLKNHFLTWENCFFNTSLEELKKAKINEPIAQEFLIWIKKINPDEELEKLTKENISIITIESENYPKLLKEIHNPPQIIYYQGNISKINEHLNIAIVGSRKYTMYGELVSKRLGQELASNKINIISGLALGIDAIAHSSALKIKGYTVAVLGTSLKQNEIYPKENKDLAQAILNNNGCLISEFPLGTKPLPFNFPQRNRIISGISQGILVIEASQKSGTLITARLALEQNREVFAVPGNIYNQSSQGTNNLIKQGAIPVTECQDILNHFDLNQKSNKTKNILENKIDEKILESLTNQERLVYDLLNDQAIQIDDLIRKTKLETNEINCILTNLELEGLIKNIGAKQYIKNY